MNATDSDRRAARTEAKRTQILDAAQRLFLAHGYAASTDAIAAAAGVSKQTLYAYAASKEELLVAVLRRLVNPEAPDGFEPFGPDHTPADAAELRRDLLALARWMLDRIMQPAYLALLRVIVAEAPRQPDLGELFRATLPERGFRAVRNLLGRAADNGVVAAEDLDAATRLFVGALLTYALLDGLFAAEGPTQPAPERVEGIVDLFLRAVL